MTATNGDTTNGTTPMDFLNALFIAGDYVSFRPIETWIDNGKKISKVDYEGIDYGRNGTLEKCFQRQLSPAEETRANVFFGVCPRRAPHQFDEAWHVRTVRVLWSDIDGTDVFEVLERIQRAGLPEPSIVVASGHGCHVYWILAEPYLIDDAGEPTPVYREWDEAKKKFRKYIEVDGERLYQDVQNNRPRLSVKALYIQDILRGIAQTVGGDHTHDLSRILRLPGTLNRKDQRNGKEPVPCSVHWLRPDLRYPLEVFAPFVERSPAKTRRNKVAAVKLPVPRKISAKRQGKLDDLILQCSLAPVGQRSETDWAVVCYCVEQGVDKQSLWSQLAHVGKFAERGEAYFETTWANAEQHTRENIYAQAEQRQSEEVCDIPESSDQGRCIIRVRASLQPVVELLNQITEELLRESNCFRRADQLVTVHNDTIHAIIEPSELTGLLSEFVEFKVISGDREKFTPLPSRYAATWLNNRRERARLPEIRVFSPNPLYVADWRLTSPGFDVDTGVYCAGPPIRPATGTEHLDRLLKEFCFAHPADRTNYMGMLLTTLLVERFVGSKPALLLNGNQPELGKSTLAQIVAILRDGAPSGTATYNPNDEEFEKRLGAILRRGASTFIIDNAKPTARQATQIIDSAVLERSITDPILSYRLLGHSAEIRAENSAIFVITANSAEVSRDIFSRCVVVGLFLEGNPSKRRFETADPEAYALEHREVLLGELAGMIERWKLAGMPLANTDTRFNKKGWGNIVGGILEVNGEPDFLDNMADAAEQMDVVRREFEELIGVVGSQGGVQVWTARELAQLAIDHDLLRGELKGENERSLTTRMGLLAGRFIKEEFLLTAGRCSGKKARFGKREGRKTTEYTIEIVD